MGEGGGGGLTGVGCVGCNQGQALNQTLSAFPLTESFDFPSRAPQS